MDHYIEIIVLPDPEFSANTLMSAAFSKLHRALFDVGRGEVGVSFPHHGKTLGDCLRLHGTGEALTRLIDEPWLKGLRDYTSVAGIQRAPEGNSHCVVERVQVKSNEDRLLRRSVRNGRLTEEEAVQRIGSAKDKRTKLPYLQLTSLSNGSRYPLFIRHGPVQESAVAGSFNHFGLSKSATVPYF